MGFRFEMLGALWDPGINNLNQALYYDVILQLTDNIDL